MVVDVQNSDLMIIFPQNEKEGIHELNEFGEIVPPEDTYDLERKKEVLEALHIVGAFNPFVIQVIKIQILSGTTWTEGTAEIFCNASASALSVGDLGTSP